ncbi:DEAD/DEAH box helicase [Candidatus Woesearchaeota archaeon]|nr:DEAD/DEAH box helicase [Candidatus Woesearchaeota archaeon]
MESLQLQAALLKAVREMGFDKPTDIQTLCIPEIRKGHDIVGQSSTGSGKTAAFGLPLLEKIQPRQGIQALILTPTRELCVQNNEALNKFAKYAQLHSTAIYGGVGIQPQIDALQRVEIVVGTPGRILDHLERGTLRLDRVNYLVLDEADKMLEMGFIEDVERIISAVPQHRQTLLFSATMPSEIKRLVKRYLRDPKTITSEIYVDNSLLNQVYYVIPMREKFSLLVHLVQSYPNGISLVFCATRSEVDVVTRNLKLHGVRAMAIHGGLTQNKRSIAVDSLRKEHINVLVATDVAARGLDIRNISHVYNYDVPKTSDEYVHRIGRTARAGQEGDAITLLSERDYENFNRVLQDRSLTIKRAQLPQFQIARFQRFSRPQGGRFPERPQGRFQSRGRSQGRFSRGHRR